MIKEIKTVREATEYWTREFNAIIKALREVWKEGRNYNAAITVLKGHTPRSLNAAAQAKYPYYSREAAVSKFVMDSVRAVAKKNAAAAA